MKPYPSYKESGVEWIGKIPVDWNTKRISHFFIERRETVDDRSYPPLSVTMKGIKEQLEGVAKTDNNDSRKKVCKGDFVINSRSDRKGSSGVSFRDGSVSVINTVLEPVSIHPQYVHHLLRSYYFIEEFFRHGKGIHFDLWSTKYTTMRNIEIPDLSLQEQQQISKYLDHKIQQIGSLIGKTQQKVELLKEQRISLTDQVITKGLDPNVKMKDSGVEWIGVFPSHWKHVPLKYICIHNSGIKTGPFGTQLNTKDYEEKGIKVLNQKTLINEDYSLGTEYISEEKYGVLSGFDVIGGDIILGTRGSFGNINRTTFGKCSIVPDNIGKCVLHPCLIRIRLKESEVDKKFFKIYTNESSIFLEEIVNTSNSTTIEVIYGITLKDVKYIIPPIKEQKQIVDYLDKETSKIDSLIVKETQRIDLLKEYRQSLISEVVTGNMDVRDEVVA